MTYKSIDDVPMLAPRTCNKHVVCKDGATVSVQANRSTYCTPRDDRGPYTHVEAGFPSVMPPPSWLEYCEDPNDPLETVYGFMPLSCITEFLNEHGGPVEGELPDGAY